MLHPVLTVFYLLQSFPHQQTAPFALCVSDSVLCFYGQLLSPPTSAPHIHTPCALPADLPRCEILHCVPAFVYQCNQIFHEHFLPSMAVSHHRILHPHFAPYHHLPQLDLSVVPHGQSTHVTISGYLMLQSLPYHQTLHTSPFACASFLCNVIFYG